MRRHFRCEIVLYSQRNKIQRYFPTNTISGRVYACVSDASELYLIPGFPEAVVETEAQYVTVTSGISCTDRYSLTTLQTPPPPFALGDQSVVQILTLTWEAFKRAVM